ncbi:unnamed protein product, partial [Symbiodinium sp. CCMP2456]
EFLDPADVFAADSSSSQEDVVRWVSCVILKHDYTAENLTVAIGLPATEGEAIDAVQAARDPNMRELFPSLVPVLPQPYEGTAVFLAAPPWYTGYQRVCLDTTRFDRRLFTAFAPAYASRADLLFLANLHSVIEPDVWVGVDPTLLVGDLQVHMFPGILVWFMPSGIAPPSSTTLGRLLTEPDGWSTESVVPAASFDGAYCLVSHGQGRLYITDYAAPTHYRRNIALTTGIPLQNLRLFAAQPRPYDVAIQGVPCRTVLAAGEHREEVQQPPWHLVILDCRPIEDGYRALRAYNRVIDVQSLLDDFQQDTPFGWCVCLSGGLPQIGELETLPGQLLSLRYVPRTAAVGASSPEGAPLTAGSGEAPAPVPGSHSPTGRDQGEPSDDGEVSVRDLPEADGNVRPVEVTALVLSPDYAQEEVRFVADFPLAQDELLRQVTAARDPDACRRFPVLIPAPVQPPFAFVCILAVPDWAFAGVPIVISCAEPPFRIFAAVVPSAINTDGVLRLAGVQAEARVQVFVGDVPWAAAPDVTITVRPGDLVSIVPVGDVDVPPLHLAQMLHDASGWHDDSATPGPFGEAIWLLTDRTHRLFRPDRQGRRPLRAVVGELMQIPPPALMFMPADPPIRNHARSGIVARQVFLSVRLHNRNDVPFILDARPVLLFVDWNVAVDGRVDVAAVCSRHLSRCPPGFCVRLTGGHAPRGYENHFRQVHAGQVLTLEYVPRWTERTPRYDGRGPGPDDDPDAPDSDEDRALPDATYVGRSVLIPPAIEIPPAAAVAFFLARTLLEELFDYFVEVPMRNGDRRASVLSLVDLIPEGMGNAAVATSPQAPDCFDLTGQQCLLPGDPLCIRRLFEKVPFGDILPAPGGLCNPSRFSEWILDGCVGRCPGPKEALVLTSDGSFLPADSSAGWGISLSFIERGASPDSGQFGGCLYGSLARFRSFLGSSLPDPYDAEVAGLLWCAALALKLPLACPVVFRADNISALQGVAGASQMRQSPLCVAARSLHAAVSILYAGSVSYAHVAGHAGDPANELSDALAFAGASRTDLPCAYDWPVEHFLSDQAIAAQWVPHTCLSLLRPDEVPCLKEQVMTWPREPGACDFGPEFALRPFLRAFPQAPAPGPSEGVGSSSLVFRAATYNALSLLDGARAGQMGLHGAVGRPTLLQRSLAEAGVHMAGLQECRTPAGRSKCGDFTRFSSGCDDASCFGVELWISDQGPCPASSCVVLHADPTRLIAGLSLSDTTIRVLVGHAPHRSHTAAFRSDWWSATTRLCQSFSSGLQWLLMLDANARLGSRVTSSVGSHQADEEDMSGDLFQTLLSNLNVWLPSTFFDSMWGEGGTLLQKRSGAFDRSDYVGVPADWRDCDCRAWTEPRVTSGHACVDHIAAIVQTVLCFPRRHVRPRAKRIDAAALSKPENSARIAGIIQTAPRPGWRVDSSEHAAIVVEHLYQGLLECFPLEKRRLHARFLSESTSTLHQTVSSLRHAIRTQKSALRYAYLRCALAAWRGLAVDFTDAFSGRWLWMMFVRFGRNCLLLRRLGRKLRQACRDDKADYLSRLSSEIADAPCRELHTAVQRVLRPRKYRKASNDPLPTLRRANGTTCVSEAEITDAWRDHFSTLEGGSQIAARDLVEKCRDAVVTSGDFDPLNAASVPSWTSLEAAFRHSAPRKAAGPDLLPPGICRHFSASMTELFWPLLLKTVCRVSEPIGFKGGILYHIDKGKAGCRGTCDAHRGILAQSCLAKTFHRSLRGLVVKHWNMHSLPMQLGGKSGCSSVFGHLCSRSILSFARSQTLSAGLLFVDLASAYYAVIRETILGGGLADKPLAEIAGALGLTDEDLQVLHHYVAREPILQQQSADPLLTDLARQLHQQTWFVLAEDSHIVETMRGTRPGGTLADALFNVLFERVLARRASPALSESFPLVPWDGVRTPFPVDLADAPRMRITDIVYADDLCTPVVCAHPAQLRQTISAVTADTMDVLAPHALRANLGPAKTAAVVAPVGAGSRQARHEMFVTLRGRAPVWPESKGVLWLDLVPRYRHLGSLVSYDGRMGPEVRHRLALAASSFREGRRKLFACQQIPIARRAALLRSHVLSVLLAGAGSWPILQKQDWSAFSGGVLGMYRQLLGLRATGAWNLTTHQLLARVGLPSPAALLNAERLRFLGQLIRSAPDQVWALLAWNVPYRDGLRCAGAWFHSLMYNTCCLGPIEQDWPSWSRLLGDQPGKWKGLLKRAEACDVEIARLRASFDSAVRALWVPEQPTLTSPLAGMEHGCLICGLAFASRQQWGAHAQKVHGYRNLAAKLAIGRTCRACHSVYATASRLKTHLLYSARCRKFLETHASDLPDPDLSKAGHEQMPAFRCRTSESLPPAGQELSSELLTALQAASLATDQDIYDVVASVISPLPVLRRTLLFWQSTLPPGGVADAAADVALVLFPEHVCSRVCGKLPDAAPGPAFAPLLVVPVLAAPDASLPVLWVGALDHDWITAWGLDGHLCQRVEPCELPVCYCVCAGLCVRLSPPPFGDPCFLDPVSKSLRLLRRHSDWIQHFLSVLRCCLGTAYVGTPVSLRVPFCFGQFEPLSTWLQQVACVAGEASPSCFTVEFNAMDTSF